MKEIVIKREWLDCSCVKEERIENLLKNMRKTRRDFRDSSSINEAGLYHCYKLWFKDVEKVSDMLGNDIMITGCYAPEGGGACNRCAWVVSHIIIRDKLKSNLQEW